MLDLSDRRCVVVGGGTVAARKIAGLLEAQARVTVISPEIVTEIADLLDRIQWWQQTYTRELLSREKPFLVFACTDQPAVNQNVAQDARTCGALVSVTDRSSSSDFSTMVLVRRPPLTISIHTGGASPALAKHLGACIGAMVGDEYPILARWLGDLRQTLQEQSRSQTERQQLYEAIIESDVLDLLREGQSEQAYGRFQSLIDTWAERA